MNSQARIQQELANNHTEQREFNLTSNVIEAFEFLSSPTTYPAGVEIFQQGATAQNVFFLSEGIVKRVRIGRHGQELIVNLGFPGRLLGAASVILNRPFPVTVTTLTACHIYNVSAENFLKLYESNSRVAKYVSKVLSQENHEHIVRASHLAYLSAQERLEQLLSQLISALKLKSQRGEVRLRLPLKQVEIAELIAVTPEHLCVVLKRMNDMGLIRREKGWIIVPDIGSISIQSDF